MRRSESPPALRKPLRAGALLGGVSQPALLRSVALLSGQRWVLSPRPCCFLGWSRRPVRPSGSSVLRSLSTSSVAHPPTQRSHHNHRRESFLILNIIIFLAGPSFSQNRKVRNKPTKTDLYTQLQTKDPRHLQTPRPSTIASILNENPAKKNHIRPSRDIAMCSADIFLGLLAILFPPLPVWIKCGICSADSLINILLCVLGFIPGLIHAWYIIAKHPEPAYDYDALPQDQEAGGRVTYVYVQSPSRRGLRQNQQQPQQPAPHGVMNYGSTNNNQAGDNAQQSGPSSSSHQQRAVPPSYAEVVAGDHKIQTRD